MVTVHARGLNSSIKDYQTGNSLVVHWLGLCSLTAKGPRFNPGWEVRSYKSHSMAKSVTMAGEAGAVGLSC